MGSSSKPIKLFGQHGPNPSKVMIILEELQIPYEKIPVPISEVKKPEFTAVNPNGRIPAIEDPNTGITIWESGAIIEYLIERYDTQHKISFAPGTPEAWHAKQWLFFQTTGQGPYYGQAAWFKKYHPEHLPSALKRYVDEMKRITGVLDGWLAKQKQVHGSGDGPWLVGNKLSYADISFVSWQEVISILIQKEDYDVDEFPLVKEWLDKMHKKESVKAGLLPIAALKQK